MNIADLLRSSGPGPEPETTLGIEPGEDTTPRLDDPLFNLRTRAQEALFDRLGARLFDPNLGEDQLRAYAVRELDAILSTEAEQLDADERHALVESIGADIMGLGPIEALLADPTVTEIMVNADDAIFVERGGRLYLTEARFMTVAPPPPGHREDRVGGRSSHRRVVADGRRPPPRRQPGERHHPPPGRRRADADRPQVRQAGLHLVRPGRVRHAEPAVRPTSSTPASGASATSSSAAVPAPARPPC